MYFFVLVCSLKLDTFFTKELEGIWLRIEAILPSYSSNVRAKVIDVFVSISKTAIQIDKSRGNFFYKLSGCKPNLCLGETISSRVARFVVDYIFDPESCPLVLSVINDLHLDEELSQSLRQVTLYKLSTRTQITQKRRRMIQLIDYLDSSQYLPFMKGLFEIIRNLLKETDEKLFPWIEVFRIFTYSAPMTIFRDILCLLDIEISNIPSIGMVIQRYYEKFAAVNSNVLTSFRMQDLAILILIFSIHEDTKNNIASMLDSLSEHPEKIQLAPENYTEDTFCGLFMELISFQDTEYLLVYVLELCYHWLSNDTCCNVSTRQRATTIVVSVFQRQACSRGEIVHYIFFEMAEPSHTASYLLHLCEIIESLIRTNIIDLVSFVSKIEEALQFLESLPIVVCTRFLKSLCRFATVSHSFTDFLNQFLQQKAFGRYIGGQCLGAIGFIAILSEKSLERVRLNALNILRSLVTRSSYGVRLVIYEGWKRLVASEMESQDSIVCPAIEEFLSDRLEELGVAWKVGEFSLKDSFGSDFHTDNSICYPTEPIAQLLHCLWTIDPDHPSLAKCLEWFCCVPNLLSCVFSNSGPEDDEDIASFVCRIRALHNVGDVLLQFFHDPFNRTKLIRSLTVLYELEDFLLSRCSLSLELDPIAFGVSASNVLIEKDVVRDMSVFEQCHCFEILCTFISSSLDDVNALYIFLRKLSGYASSNTKQEDATSLGNLALQLISYSSRLQDNRLLRSDFDQVEWKNGCSEWWESFLQRYTSVSPRHMCLYYMLTILDTLCCKGHFLFSRDVYPETLDQLEESFMQDEEMGTFQNEHKVLLCLWNFFEAEFARKTGMPIPHAQLHLQLILQSLDQIDTRVEKTSCFSIARKVVRLLDDYSIQQTSVLRLLIRILIQCCNSSKLIFSLLHHLAVTCRTKSKPTSSDHFVKRSLDEEKAKHARDKTTTNSGTVFEENLLSSNLRVLLNTNRIPPPESESCRIAVLIVVLHHLEARYHGLPTKNLPNSESLDELANILMIIYTILVGEEHSNESKDTQQWLDASNYLSPKFVGRSLQLVSKISKTAFQWMNRIRKEISGWKKEEELSIKNFATFAENITNRLQTIIRWAWEGRSKFHFRTIRSPTLPRIQYHFAKFQVECRKILNHLDTEVRPMFQAVVQNFQQLHPTTDTSMETFDQPIQQNKLPRKTSRKKFRSRNRFIDVCLVEEGSDGDDYADLEDFLVVDKELEENGKQPVQVNDWMKRIFPQYR